MTDWRGVVLGLALGVGLGLAVGALLWTESGPAAPATSMDRPSDREEGLQAAREVIVLRERLERETARRVELEQQAAAADANASAEGSAALEADAKPDPPGGRDPFIDASILARAGFSPSEIELLKQYLETIELDRLYLRDQATREGWERKPRFTRATRALDVRAARLRTEYGDEAYDWILHARGRPNRVVVQRVMAGSEAAAIGLQEGDVFLSYDGRRIFGAPALRTATTSGELGETADVEVERNGRAVRLFPRRGPLGVTLTPESREPSEPAF